MKTINPLYTGVPVIMVSREQLELFAMEAVCACWCYDLADMLEETTDEDLVRIIMREPCTACE